MAVVAFAAGKGSPWVTVSALVFGAAWPEPREPVVADLDVSGGAIGSLFGLPSMPGLTTLAAVQGRGDADDGGLLAHCQRLPGGLPVLVAPLSPSAVAGALPVVVPELAYLAATAGVDVLVDAGRLVNGDGPGRLVNGHLIAAADVVVLLTRPTVAGVASFSATLPSVQAILEKSATPAAIMVILAGSGGYPADEIADHFHVSVLGTLPSDCDAAAIATGQAGGRLERTRLFRSARSMAADILACTSVSRACAPSEVVPASVAVGP